jgi:riboflavin kinase
MGIDHTYRYLEILLYLAAKTKAYEPIKTSTVRIAKGVNSSQQTISRKLMEMEVGGLIKREPDQRGMRITITEKAYKQMKGIQNNLEAALAIDVMSLRGKVVTGYGEGGYYVSLKGYREQFQEHLGITPYPGTLNVEINPIRLKQFTEGLASFKISGFNFSGRTFGEIDAYPIKLVSLKNSSQAFLIIPKRTTHPPEIAEVIAKYNLREKLNLLDGSRVSMNKEE